MTKRELIEMLKDYEDDAIIVIAEDYIDPWSGHCEGLNLYEIKVNAEDNTDKKYFKIRKN